MPRRSLALVLFASLLAACGSAPPSPSPPAPPGGPSSSAGSTRATVAPSPAASADPAAIGHAFIDALSRGDTAGAQAMEDAAMLAAAPAPKLGQLWQGLVAQYGAFQSIGTTSTQSQPPYTIAVVAVAFAGATVTLTVAVNSSGQVGGLHVAAVGPAPSAGPAGSPPPPSASPAAYVDQAAFSERAVTVGSAPWALPGTLSMPDGAGPFPGVVLVQGSGPMDRDGTVGPNKPYRDLAWGLASAGIAVLRYDKRTYVYGAQMAASASTVTVRQETTDDAVAAVAVLRATPGVDPSRVYLVGHSLGAYLAPRIAAQVPGRLHGIGLLEAPSSGLAQLILDQEGYLASLQGSPSPSAQDALASLRAQVALAESPALSASTPASSLPLGIPASYWLDLRTYDPLATASGLGIPMFFSQGGRDYQVPPSELGPWERALAGRTGVVFRTYPAMDHLLLDGSGTPSPAEYSVPGHVDAQLVADLAAWIRTGTG